MLGQYLITFREVFEAALLVSILLAYLYKMERGGLAKYVWFGVGGAVLGSILLGGGIAVFYGGLSEAYMKLFEGIAALFAVCVLTWMIFWMAVKGRFIESEVKGKVDAAVKGGSAFGLAGLAFVLVFREGLETVLFLTPFGVSSPGATFLGAGLGLVSAIVLSVLVFVVGKRIDIKKFFLFSSILLILLAGGLAGYGIHELLEYFEAVNIEVGWLGTYAYELNIAKDSIWYHKGVVGSVFAVLFGYSVKMEWARVFVHGGYLLLFLPLTLLVYKFPDRFLSVVAKLGFKTGGELEPAKN